MSQRATPSQIEQVLDAIVADISLQVSRLFARGRDWAEEDETAKQAVAAHRLPAESVAAHSWHVADSVLMVGPLAFPQGLALDRAVALAVVHDKFTGGWDLASDLRAAGPGLARQKMSGDTLRASLAHLAQLPQSVIGPQADLLAEIAGNATNEARLVNAVDKLQAVVSLMARTGGQVGDDHLRFALSFTTPATVRHRGHGT